MSILGLFRRANHVANRISLMTISGDIQRFNLRNQLIGKQNKLFSTTQIVYDINEDVNKKLMEFFDDSKNWNENEVKHGRSWLLPELRIKSNTDLHKLWFVLLKELNMLKTMEHEYKREWRYWASPERIDKVQESMKNIEIVVRERNQAFHLLETGNDGERPGNYITNALGLRQYKKSIEHVIPYWMNKKWREENKRGCSGPEMQEFLRFYREKLYNEKRKSRNRDKNHVIRLLRRFPNLDHAMLKEKYPSINFDTLRIKDLYRGHYVPKVD